MKRIIEKIGEEYIEHMEKYFLRQFARTVKKEIGEDRSAQADLKMIAASEAAFKIFLLGLTAREKEIMIRAKEEIEKSRK